MISKKVADLLNDQINKEFYSSYLYLEISNYYYSINLDGFGSWFKIQAQEEQDHAMLILQFSQNNNIDIKLTAIDAPNGAYDDFKSPLVSTLEHERYVTGLINTIYSEAMQDKDYRTLQFLDWFVKEQGEEEKNTQDLIKRFELFATDAKGLYMLDSELGARVYSAPSLVL